MITSTLIFKIYLVVPKIEIQKGMSGNTLTFKSEVLTIGMR